MRSVFRATVEQGKMKFDDPKSFSKVLNSLIGKKIAVIIDEDRKPRSLNANSYYWAGIIKPCADYCGYTQNEMHEAFGLMFRIEHRQGLPPKVKSTTEMDTNEFYEYCERCRQWAAEQNIIIPDPDGYTII